MLASTGLVHAPRSLLGRTMFSQPLILGIKCLHRISQLLEVFTPNTTLHEHTLMVSKHSNQCLHLHHLVIHTKQVITSSTVHLQSSTQTNIIHFSLSHHIHHIPATSHHIQAIHILVVSSSNHTLASISNNNLVSFSKIILVSNSPQVFLKAIRISNTGNTSKYQDLHKIHQIILMNG